MTLTDNQWKVILGVGAAIVAYVLAQPDVPLAPWAKLVLGAVAVGLAVLDPNRSHSA